MTILLPCACSGGLSLCQDLCPSIPSNSRRSKRRIYNTSAPVTRPRLQSSSGARLLLLAHQHPTWRNAEIARRVGCCVQTVKHWRQRWQQTESVRDVLRAGTRRTARCSSEPRLPRACSSPRAYGNPGHAGRGRTAHVAVEQQIVAHIAPGTIRTWLCTDKIKPRRYHSWQRSTDPRFVDKASPVLDLYEHAPELAAQGEAVVCSDEKTSIQARQRVSATQAGGPGWPIHVADRYKRMGAVQLFCALMVASGLTFLPGPAAQNVRRFQSLPAELFQSALCMGLKVVHLILDNGSTHAAKQLGPGLRR